MKRLSVFLLALFLVAQTSSRLSLVGFSFPDKPAKTSPINLRVGLAKVDITPPVGTPLGGYGGRGGAPSTGIHDPLEARALVLDNGEEKIAIVGVDILMVYPRIMDKVRKIVLKETGIKPDHLFVCASHTHSGSGAYWPKAKILLGSFNRQIRKVLSEKIAKSIILANKELKPALLGIGAGQAKNISCNRSYHKPGLKYGPDGITDYEVGVLRLDDLKGNIISVVMNFAIHPTVLGQNNMEFSADFVGYARSTLERMLYPKSMSIYINGALGDQSPKRVPWLSGFSSCERIGNILAGETFKTLQDIQPTSKVKIKVARGTLAVAQKLSSEMQALVINDTIIITIPGELFSIIGQEIKKKAKESGFKHAFIWGLCNDQIGYILTKEAFSAQPPVYERVFCFGGAYLGQRVKDLAFKLIEEVK